MLCGSAVHGLSPPSRNQEGLGGAQEEPGGAFQLPFIKKSLTKTDFYEFRYPETDEKVPHGSFSCVMVL